MSAPTSLQAGSTATGLHKQPSSLHNNSNAAGNNQFRYSFERANSQRGLKSTSAGGDSGNSQQATGKELIETRFNELAKKILEELAQVQYSRDFFQAVDDIIKEPASKSFAHNQSISQQFRYFNRQAAAATAAAAAAATAAANAAATAATAAVTNRQEQFAAAVAVAAKNVEQQHQLHQQQQLAGRPSSANSDSHNQPRSLPAEATGDKQQVSPAKQQQQLQSQTQRARKSTIPTSSVQNGFIKSQQQSLSVGAYPISKSATTGDATTSPTQRNTAAMVGKQQSVSPRRSPTMVAAADSDEVLAAKLRLSQHQQQQILQLHQQHQQDKKWPKLTSNKPNRKHHAASKMLTGNLSRSVDQADLDDDDDNDNDDDDDDNDDDDDFDDDDDDDDNDDLSPEINHRRKHLYLNQSRFGPIAKSKTLSDTLSNFSEESSCISNSRQTHPQLQPAQQQQQKHLVLQQPKPRQPRQRFNPIVRSNTIGASGLQPQLQQSHHRHHASNNNRSPTNLLGSGKQHATILNGKDIGHLYKPHMNYSTSVLGNHRLSDDDEIIIIPTQSPSLLSPSPDSRFGNDTDGDELAERFSISRTKSFWEKLSKGSPTKQQSGVEQAAGGASRGGSAGSASGGEQASSALHQRQVSTVKSAAMLAQQQLGGGGGGAAHNAGGCKQTVSSNGTKSKSSSSSNGTGRMERMDSTGGSNSNYSSSGDENNLATSKGNSRSVQQNPTISQIQEMSRMNRFRQTR